jgi:transposase InsO family protein
VWSPRRAFRQDIGDGSLKTSATGLARHRRQRTDAEVGACQRPASSSPPCSSTSRPRRGRRPLRHPPLLGLQAQARYQADGEAAFEPRSRRPKTNPTAIPPATVALIVELPGKLSTAGLDAGPDTIAWHLSHHHGTTVSVSTISRTLTRAGLVTPTPKKRPKTSYQRFQAELPNQCWQADCTPYRLAGSPDAPAADAES